MELGENLNHLNAPKKITLKFPNTPSPPPPPHHRNGHNTGQVSQLSDIMKCDQLPPLSFFFLKSTPPLSPRNHNTHQNCPTE